MRAGLQSGREVLHVTPRSAEFPGGPHPARARPRAGPGPHVRRGADCGWGWPHAARAGPLGRAGRPRSRLGLRSRRGIALPALRPGGWDVWDLAAPRGNVRDGLLQARPGCGGCGFLERVPAPPESDRAGARLAVSGGARPRHRRRLASSGPGRRFAARDSGSSPTSSVASSTSRCSCPRQQWRRGRRGPRRGARARTSSGLGSSWASGWESVSGLGPPSTGRGAIFCPAHRPSRWSRHPS
jgi:hypothetical protein